MNDSVKYTLNEDDIPYTWLNIAADFGEPAPILDPATGAAITRAELCRTIAEPLVDQELSTEPEFEIPGPVRDIYRQWRPTPLYRARRLERALDTPARIYYKYEGVSPVGSLKPNSAVPQAYYNKQIGKTGLVTETGAGQWGSSIASAAAMFGLSAQVFMVGVSYRQKPYRRALMEAYGAICNSSPSPLTAAGRAVLAEDPDHPGSLGIAKSEALEVAYANPDLGYTRGSSLNHVCAHQTVIGQEAMLQMELAEDYPDIVVGPCGGGSTLAGMCFPFLRDKLRRGREIRLVAAEPVACPTLTRGRIAYDHSDAARLTPLSRMHTLGHKFVPPPVHAGGLRAHDISPLISRAVENGLMEAVAVRQTACFEAGVLFAREEGIVPAPESAHAVRAAIDEALRCREQGQSKAILIALSGHGHFDLAAYEMFQAGLLPDDEPTDDDLAHGLSSIPDLARA
ncbi:TrpB-like pyridoxal phosphate-dependent enzyme [Nonomuraea sp. NPDC050227]|uniref:TrpB-like pyridoxal phosphate-dependent enzyme n=1 Tax=Nonomuraea sp. NPDC050227 TaxID=3364360 RepID=UPI00379C90A3